MVFVALSALDFTAIRAVFDHRGRTSYLLGLGAMSMANVLVVGLLVGHRSRGGRRFLIGFEAFGTMALAA
jgi:presenilin-like A22 family membrane protease